MVLVNDADLQMPDDAPEGIAQNHELHQRKDQGNSHEDRAAPEPPQISLDHGQDAMHVSFQESGVRSQEEDSSTHRREEGLRGSAVSTEASAQVNSDFCLLTPDF